MRVIYTYITADTEGSKVHIDSFIKAFRSLGEEVVDAGIITKPFTANKAEWSLAQRLWAKVSWLFMNISILFNLLWLAKDVRPDIVLFRFMPNHQFFFPIFVLSFLYPVVLEINALRSIENPTEANWLINLLDKISLRRVKRCFVVSQNIKDHLLGRNLLGKEKVAIIENGVDLEHFSPDLPADNIKQILGLNNTFVVGFVGSFKPWHGIENIISLAEAIKPEGIDIRFLIVGDGKERSNYEEMIKAKGLEGSFIFTGFIEHDRVHEYIAAMDVAIAPHKSDSFKESGGFHGSPLKIFEYMAMAKPIITAPIGQIKDIIIDGQSGRLIFSEDINALKAEIKKLYADKMYRQTLAINARKRVEERYSWKENAIKVRTLFNMVLHNNASDKKIGRKIKIAILLPSIHIGGAEKLVIEELSYLKSDPRFSFEVHLVFEKGAFFSDLSSLGLPVYVWNAPHKSIRMFKTYWNIGCHLRRTGCDILHTHLLDGIGPLVGKLAGVKVVATVHSDKKYTNIERFVLRQSDLALGCGKQVKTNISSFIHNGKVGILCNGIRKTDQTIIARECVLEHYGLSPSCKLVVSLGRLKTQKGYDVLIRAFKKVVSDVPDAALLIGGDGEERDRLNNIVESEGLHEKVKLPGSIRDIHSLLSSCDLYVNSSRWEGLPITLLEAMAHGRPIVATKAGGNSEVVHDGVTGILVPPDNTEQLSAAIIRMLQDDYFRKKVGHEAFTLFNNQYTIEKHCDALVEYYLQLACDQS